MDEWVEILYDTHFWVEPQKYVKILLYYQFLKFLSEFWHVISNYTYQQVMNSNMGSNMAPLMVSRGGGHNGPPPWEPQNLIGRGRVKGTLSLNKTSKMLSKLYFQTTVCWTKILFELPFTQKIVNFV